MKKTRIIGIIALLALTVLIGIRLKNNKDITEAKVYQYDKAQSVNVYADTLQLEYILGDLSFTGTFEPFRETKLSSEIQGKINRVLVDAGSHVRKGDVLIQLDNSLLKLQLQSIDVQIAGLTKDVNRYTILANADAIQGVQLEKAELGLKSAKVQRATLQEQINKTTIRAPFNGVVTNKLTEAGAFAAPGVPLLQITDISRLKFTVLVPENDLSKFQKTNDYTIIPDAYPDIPFSSSAPITGSKANMGSSFPVQFTVQNTPSLIIKSGMFGKVSLSDDSPEKGIIIPSSSIIGSSENPQVYLIKDGKAVLQNITIAKRIQTRTVVSFGLKPGDILITSGFINLFDGANVTVQ